MRSYTPQSHLVAGSIAVQAATECEVAGLDRVQEQRGLGPAVLDEHERRVALQLRQAERRLQPPDDGLEQVAGDRRGVLDLAPRQVCGVAGEVGERRKPVSGVAPCQKLDLGATPMSMPVMCRCRDPEGIRLAWGPAHLDRWRCEQCLKDDAVALSSVLESLEAVI